MKPIQWPHVGVALLLSALAASANAELTYPATTVRAIDANLSSPVHPVALAWETAALPAMALDAQRGERLTALSTAGDELSLWAFMSTLRSLQTKQTFSLVASNARLVELSAANVAPVPLPGAAWLMVMGLAGLAGMRLTRATASPSHAGAGAGAGAATALPQTA